MKDICRSIYLFFLCGSLLIIGIGCNVDEPLLSITPTTQTPAETLQPTNIFKTGSVEIVSTPVLTATDQPIETPSGDVVWGLIEQIDLNRVLIDLRKLTGEEPICNESGCYTISNRNTGSEGLQWAKHYIIDELEKVGYSVEASNWSRSGYADQNLIIKKQGVSQPGEEVYFVAHLDGATPDQVERYPGADDDASGVVDLLELARVFSGYSSDCTLVFFFSTGEEQGSLGANSYLDQLSWKELNSIKYVVNIDMIGYDADQDGVMQFFHGNQSEAKSLTATMEEIITNYQIDLTSVLTKGCP